MGVSWACTTQGATTCKCRTANVYLVARHPTILSRLTCFDVLLGDISQKEASRERCRASVAAKPVPPNGAQVLYSTATDAEPSAPGTPSATVEHRGSFSKVARPDIAATTAADPAAGAMRSADPPAQPPAPADAVSPPKSDASSLPADDDPVLRLHSDSDVRAAQQAVLSGQPYDTARYGAYKPPCQPERYATLAAIQASHGSVIIEDPDISARL